jgi:hypothetical protein
MVSKESRMMTTNNGYSHGSISCKDCFAGSENIMALGDWRLHNNPGYYGSSSPEILILGFSKGANQNKVALGGDFDKIAFANARHRLQIILETLEIMPKNRSIDDLMTAKEKQFGIASLVRCSFGKMQSNGTCKTSGDVIPSSFKNRDTLEIIETCSKKYLSELPKSTKLVVLLGASEMYIKKTTDLIQRLYTDFLIVNDVSFVSGGALWIYATHPSPGNGYFNAWVKNGWDDKSGHKRLLAIEALAYLTKQI